MCELKETKARIFTSHLTQYYGTLTLIFITAQHFWFWTRPKPRNNKEYTYGGGEERNGRIWVVITEKKGSMSSVLKPERVVILSKRLAPSIIKTQLFSLQAMNLSVSENYAGETAWDRT